METKIRFYLDGEVSDIGNEAGSYPEIRLLTHSELTASDAIEMMAIFKIIRNVLEIYAKLFIPVSWVVILLFSKHCYDCRDQMNKCENMKQIFRFIHKVSVTCLNLWRFFITVSKKDTCETINQQNI
jgi:hypothetical protein